MSDPPERQHPGRYVDITWVEKYITYEQNTCGGLTPTDYHFLAEVCYADSEQFENVQALLYAEGSDSPLATFGANDPRAFTNGYYYTRKSKSYDDLPALEAAHPADNAYVWEITGPRGTRRLAPVRVGGRQQRTQIPESGPIFLLQDGEPVADHHRVRYDLPLTIRWRPFTSGTSHPGTEWDDLIFALVSNAQGEVVYTGGAPGAEGGFLDYTKTSTEVPGGIMEPGMDHVVFVSQVKYVDNNLSNGIQQLACNSFAVELPIRTDGKSGAHPAPARKAPYLWSGKTPAEHGLVPWPTFSKHRSGRTPQR